MMIFDVELIFLTVIHMPLIPGVRKRLLKQAVADVLLVSENLPDRRGCPLSFFPCRHLPLVQLSSYYMGSLS